ncbi:MAG: DUF3990 domain-containing protein [Oscillospiraceae bacterium]|jgi:hypothetical protein|nr:DUF3990 domain-containing protein [Oscillospiraceae bacterium]
MNTENKTSIITVYHGTTSLIDTIDVTKGKPYKDFGRGFYVTEDYNHAKNLAIRNKRLEQSYGKQDYVSYVYTYSFDLNKARDYKLLEFDIADVDWMRFVLANRNAYDKKHDYDIIIGPTANDDTSIVLKSYFNGLYGDIDSEKALKLALDMIEAENLPEQIYFGSNQATSCLTQKGAAKRV